MTTQLHEGQIGVEQQPVREFAAGLIDHLAEGDSLGNEASLQGLGVDAELAGYQIGGELPAGQQLADDAARSVGEAPRVLGTGARQVVHGELMGERIVVERTL